MGASLTPPARSVRRWLAAGLIALLGAAGVTLGAATAAGHRPGASAATGRPGASAATGRLPTAARRAGPNLLADATAGRWQRWTVRPPQAATIRPAALGLGLQAAGNHPWSVWSGSPAGGLVPVTPGALVRASASAAAPGPPLRADAILAFYDAAGSLLTTVWGASAALAASPTALPGALGLAPPGTSGVALGVAFYTPVVGQQLQVAGATVRAGPPPDPPPVAGPLHVVGNHILDARGRVFVPRGVNLTGFEMSPDPSGIDATLIRQIRGWGATMVRVAVGEQYWLAQSCQYAPGYRQRIDQVVRWITAAGMVALLDLHATTAGGVCGTAGPQPMADAAFALTFWRQVAARYRSNPLVAFDLFNEPQDISSRVWLSGGTVHSWGRSWPAAGMQQLYDAVRGAGARNLVVVSGVDWANRLPQHLVAGDNIAYGVHAYTCQAAPPPRCTSPNPDDPLPILSGWVAPGATVPVVVSEFGWPSGSQGRYLQAVITTAQRHGWGWLAYTVTGTNRGPFQLVAAQIAGGPAEPSAAGMVVLRALASAP